MKKFSSREQDILKEEVIRLARAKAIKGILGVTWLTNMKIDAATRQFTIDYGKLNRQTAREQPPIPCVEDIMHFFEDCEYFCILNAFEGYQIRIHEEDEEKIGFNLLASTTTQ